MSNNLNAAILTTIILADIFFKTPLTYALLIRRNITAQWSLTKGFRMLAGRGIIIIEAKP